MSILRDDRTVAIGDVVTACHEVAEICNSVTEVIENAAATRALSDLAEERERVADELHEATVRHLGEAPSDRVPEERILLQKAATRLEELVAESAEVDLLQRCRDKEDAVRAATEAALDLIPDGDLHDRLAALRDDTDLRLGEISEMVGNAGNERKA